MKLEDAIVRLEDVIVTNYTHQHYKRVTSLAANYRMFYTGDGIDTELEKMYKIKIPKQLINSVIPPIIKSTMFPFNKVVRTKPSIKKIDFDDSDFESKKVELEDYLNTYWSGKSVENFINSILIEQMYVDPNAWLITEFNDFDPLIEKAQPYPFVATSSEVVDYNYSGGKLNYVIVKQKVKSNNRYTMYIGWHTIVYEEDRNGNVSLSNGKKYTVALYTPKSSFVPAMRIGYLTDIETRGETYLSLFDKVIPFLYKQIKVDFEGDTMMAEMAFPKRSIYVEDCKECYNGRTPDGNKCPACDGTGRSKTHRTSSDVREFPLPKDMNEVVDLSRLSHTEFPPVDGMRFLQEYKDKLKEQTFGFMFNAEMYDKTQVAATATEARLDRDNLNDALQPFAAHYSVLWMHIARSVAEFTDLNNNIILLHIMPTDFKFKGINEYMNDLKSAKDANASATTTAAIEMEILESMYSDRPEEMKAIRIKNSFNPFYGVNPERINTILSLKLTPQYNAVLWANLEPIFAELERENASPWLYDLAYDVIAEKVKEKVEEYIGRLPKPAEITPIFSNDAED
jgi:hypothetical protein